MNWLPNPDTLQHVSLPLELLGLFLVMLEMFFPKHAVRLEQAIDRAGTNLDIKSLGPFLMEFIRRTGGKGTPIYRASKHFVLSFLIHGTVCFALSYWIGSRWAVGYGSLVLSVSSLIIRTAYDYIEYIEGKYHNRNGHAPVWRPRGFWVSFFAIPYVMLHTLLFMFVGPAYWLLSQFNAVGKGHAIGGIGLLLGVIGFSMEVYQVIMIDRNWDAKSIVEVWAVYVLVVIALGVAAFFIHRAVSKGD